MTTEQTVLIVGAAGMLGGRIAAHLLDEPATWVSVLVRNANLASARNLDFARVRDRGIDVFEGDLSDTVSLDCATAGADVVISAEQGGRDTIVDGQLALLAAATRNGVRRMLPSDFALDLFRSPPGTTCDAKSTWRSQRPG